MIYRRRSLSHLTCTANKNLHETTSFRFYLITQMPIRCMVKGKILVSKVERKANYHAITLHFCRQVIIDTIHSSSIPYGCSCFASVYSVRASGARWRRSLSYPDSSPHLSPFRPEYTSGKKVPASSGPVSQIFLRYISFFLRFPVFLFPEEIAPQSYPGQSGSPSV